MAAAHVIRCTTSTSVTYKGDGLWPAKVGSATLFTALEAKSKLLDLGLESNDYRKYEVVELSRAISDEKNQEVA